MLGARRLPEPPAATHVARLLLTEFRSWPALALDAGPGMTVLYGPNGAGKTNVLEALSLLAPGRGLRGAGAAELRRDAGAADWAVAARLDTGLGPVDIGTGTDTARTGERRRVRIDGKAAAGPARLAAMLSVAWLTPVMDRLFLDGAGARRRFLDRLVFGHDPGHADRLNAYDRALRDRARLLRDGPRDGRWLGALEAAMACHGVAIAASRREIAERLDAESARGDEAFPRVHVAVDGVVERWLDDAPAVAVEERFAGALAERRGRDAESGGATVGPHRGDLAVRHRVSGRAAARCSTGEQKALLIALLLADARLVARGPRGAPILLLDDVAAHLDRDRRRALFEALAAIGAQAWLTGTDRAAFEALDGHARFLAAGGGRLTEAH
ncbi:MAG: DNA replication/repair protein RecF [Alphaproteobacteria bacterium]|nr:DNA replication/repair protein RecF [Alphaproteobacteria bacterium]